MPLFFVERDFAQQLALTDDDVRLIDEVAGGEGVRWLFSFLSADRRRTYCLYEAPSVTALTAASDRSELPTHAIIELRPDTVGVPGRVGEWAATQDTAS